MKPENPGIGGGGIQAGRGFFMCPLANVKRSRHPFLNRQERRSSSSGLGDLRGQTFVSHLTSVKASTEAFTVNPVAISAMSDRRVAPHKCHGRGKYSEFRHRRNFIDLEQLGIRFHALRGRVPVRLNLTGPRRALFSTSKEVPSGQESNKPHRTTAQAAKCCARHYPSTPARTQRRGRAWPAASGADHKREPCQRRRAPRSHIPNHALRVNQGWVISRACSIAGSQGQLLAGRGCHGVHCCGRRCPMKRGKAPAGQKASRALRRQKRTWRRQK